MNISCFKDSCNKRMKCYAVKVNKKEALLLIKSLVNQLISDSSNVERLESYTDKGEYFSIFVTEKSEVKAC